MEDPALPGKQTERPNPELDPTYDYKLPRRLVVCLDGSWNKRDSGTNIYHISNLVQEGRVKDPQTGREWFQIIYYDEGVGTGLLDSVSGGGFGIGLSENIRQAYDWLVEKYRDAREGRPADEIYIFGFSRGAFTARSLIGLIAKCGLVCRGAPISPAELWAGYQLLGRHGDPRTHAGPAKNWWERLTGGAPKIPFRSLWELKPDAWETDREEPIRPPENLAEELLVTWSRRVRIRCAGIIDTVGAMGVDMLAIPWLREKTARFHDTQLSAMVQNGFHALGIDEHRANFVHIPWRRATTRPWPADGKIEQRWFVGAHSNIGGGYDDNVLAQFPLAWILKECRDLGLVLRVPATAQADPLIPPPLDSCLPLLSPVKGNDYLRDTPPRVRDSFAEIAHGIWKHVIRSKPEYRRIGPPPEMDNGAPSESVNEFVDPSAWQLLVADQNSPNPYNPPNLWAYRQKPNLPDAKTAAPLNYPPPRHRYLQGIGSYAWLIVWLGLIAITGCALDRFLHDRWHNLAVTLPPLHSWHSFAVTLALLHSWHILAIALPLLALFADCRESVLNHAVALEPDGGKAERKLAFIDLYLFWRLVFICMVLAGIVLFVVTISPWLIKIGPKPWLLWLLALDVLMIQFGISAAWAAAPMADAGFGSVVRLQEAKTPDAVRTLLGRWTGGDFGEKGRQLLTPVARTLWRDILGFIPSYTVLLFLGTWMALSVFLTSPEERRLCMVFSTLWWTWGGAAILAILCAIADWIEDRCHLSYIKRLADPPSGGRVACARAATLVKYVLFLCGFVATGAAVVWLFCQEVPFIFSCPPQAGLIPVAVLLFTAVLFYSRIQDWISKA